MNHNFHSLAALLRETPNKRKVICITGRLAAGKTYAMSTIAHELHYFSELPTFSNYGLTIGERIGKLNYLRLYTAEHYTMICLDEGDSVAHSSRHFMGSLLSDYMKDKNLLLILTAQNINRLSGSIREKVDVIINVELERTEEGPGVIRLSSGEYERSIEIDPAKELYSFTEPAQLFI